MTIIGGAFTASSLAVLIGAGLAVAYLRPEGSPPPRWIGVCHGAFGAASLALLVLGLGRSAAGAATLAWDAAVLLGAALLGGAVLFVQGLRRRPSELLIGLHATVAAMGFVMLAAYALG